MCGSCGQDRIASDLFAPSHQVCCERRTCAATPHQHARCGALAQHAAPSPVSTAITAHPLQATAEGVSANPIVTQQLNSAQKLIPRPPATAKLPAQG